MSQLPHGMTKETVSALVKDAAMRYYTPEQMADQAGLPLDVVERFLQLPEVDRQVQKLRKELTESGERFRLVAKRLAEETIATAARIANDSNEETSDRLAAIKTIISSAGLQQQEQPTTVIQIAGVEHIQALRETNPWRNTQSGAPAPAFKPVTIEVTDD